MSGNEVQAQSNKQVSAAEILDGMQPLPANALRLVQMCQDNSTETEEIISVIKTEAAIASRVLAVANSPLYGYTRRIATIAHAVVILGIRNIKQLAVSFAAKNIYCEDGPGADFCKRLYHHSLGCALVARAMAERQDNCDPDEIFLAALLHDVGKLALIQVFPEEYTSLPDDLFAHELIQCELDRFGVSHVSIGETCAQRWGMPIGLVDVIGNHHGNPDGRETSLDSRLVEAADLIARFEGVGSPALNDGFETYASNKIVQDIHPDVRREIVEKASDELQILESAS